uniref:Guanine nucleotide-binding protein G(T) subunit alpha-1 n=1 Tax=Lygus hesperus TaxID=30085 RepID=A0A0A9WXD9_LYGHE
MRVMDKYKKYFNTTEMPVEVNSFFALQIPRSHLDTCGKLSNTPNALQDQAMYIVQQLVCGLVQESSSNHPLTCAQVGTSPLLRPNNSPNIASNTSNATNITTLSRRSVPLNSTQLHPLLAHVSPKLTTLHRTTVAVAAHVARIMYCFENGYVFGPNLLKLTITAEEFETIDDPDDEDIEDMESDSHLDIHYES